MSNMSLNFLGLQYSNGEDKESYLYSIDLKVKHFRQYNGRHVSPKGGHTAIFDTNKGLVYSSKCRSDEHFCKTTGIKVCIEKMMQCKQFPLKGYRIVNYVPKHNSADVWIAPISEL